VKSETHNAFGRSATNCRLTLSSGQGAALSLTVVLTDLPRTTPCRPMARISRSIVQRATVSPSRINCRQTFRAPSTPKFSSKTRRIFSQSAAARLARGDNGAGSRRAAARAW
jgi:hypothetical protein